jgi:hypothetical protein
MPGVAGFVVLVSAILVSVPWTTWRLTRDVVEPLDELGLYAVEIAGGGLGSVQHGAIGVFGPATLDFEQGAQILGGNGVLLSLEASAADLVEFNLRDGVLADGDIVAADPGLTPQTSNLQMLLEGDSHWKGATQVVDNLRINTGSSWTITDDSTLGSLSLDKGVVMFDAPDSNGYNTLTVQGDYHSDGGTLVFNTRLDGRSVVIDQWMESKGHRENILTKDITDIGIGIAGPSKQNRYYYCQLFGAQL